MKIRHSYKRKRNGCQYLDDQHGHREVEMARSWRFFHGYLGIASNGEETRFPPLYIAGIAIRAQATAWMMLE